MNGAPSSSGATPAVLVVGAGPVGLAVAAMLARHGVHTTVVDRRSGPIDSSRAIGIHAITLESMHALGLADELVSEGAVHRAATLNCAGREVLRVDFTRIRSPYPMVIALPQRKTEELVLNRLESAGGTVSWDTEVVSLARRGDEEYQVTMVNQGRSVIRTFEWVLACDGGRSTLRELAGISFPGGAYERSFVLGDVRLSGAGVDRDRLQFFLSRRGYLLIVPLPGGIHRVICQDDENVGNGGRRATTLQALQRLVDRNGPGHIRIRDPGWLARAPFHHRAATRPIDGRLVLLGDAFHVYSPLGGQGLNTGFQDAFNLSWKLAWHLKGWSHRELVNSYAAERCEATRRVQAVTARTTAFVTDTSRIHDLIRRFVLPWYGRLPPVRRALPRLYSGLGQRYDDTPLAGGSVRGAVHSGRRLPHAQVLLGVRSPAMPVCALVNGIHLVLFLVLAAGVTPGSRLRRDAALLAGRFARFPIRRYCTDRSVAGFVHVTVDEVRAWIGRRRGAWLLVRPDGHVAVSAALDNAQAVTGWLERVCPGIGGRSAAEESIGA